MALLPCFLIDTEPSRRALSFPARAARSSACHFQCRLGRAALRTRGGHKTGPICSGALYHLQPIDTSGLLARPKRFELLTPRFVGWCSIQLSYGRVLRNRAGSVPRHTAGTGL